MDINDIPSQEFKVMIVKMLSRLEIRVKNHKK